jgi:hypothetical protein
MMSKAKTIKSPVAKTIRDGEVGGDAPLAEMPETPLLVLLPGTSAITGAIRGSTFVAKSRKARAQE